MRYSAYDGSIKADSDHRKQVHAVSRSNRRIAEEKVDVQFLKGPNGPLFCLTATSECDENRAMIGCLSTCHTPDASGFRHIVLLVPPFGEEINLCRRFYSLLRRRLSAAGLFSVQPDLYGTGDSAGNFSDTTWEIWQHDLEYIVEQFCLSKNGRETCSSLSIVAVRAGCLVTQQLLTSSFFSNCNIELASLVLVQPEFSGADIINRLFRARITAQRFAGNKSQTSDDLWKCVEGGETVQAGGHALSPSLCQVLQKTQLELPALTGFKRKILFAAEQDNGKQNVAGWDVNNQSMKPFWQSYDIEPDISLITTVVEAVGS